MGPELMSVGSLRPGLSMEGPWNGAVLSLVSSYLCTGGECFSLGMGVQLPMYWFGLYECGYELGAYDSVTYVLMNRVLVPVTYVLMIVVIAGMSTWYW